MADTATPKTREPIATPAERSADRPAAPAVEDKNNPALKDRKPALQAMSADEMARFEFLKGKKPNPDVLPADVRTEDEEHEFRALSERVSQYELATGLEASQPMVLRLNPRQRLEQLKARGQALGEGERIEMSRLDELVHNEARVDELRSMDNRTVEESQELLLLEEHVREARAAGNYGGA